MSKEKYIKEFNLVEVQRIFYKMPRKQTLINWVNLAKKLNKNFEFTVKAWQTITHPPTSITWRKAKLVVSKNKIDKYGGLKPTEENFEAWEKIIEACKTLNSVITVIQTPPSFRPTVENIRNMYDFLGSVKRNGLKLAFEPRGEWVKQPEKIKKVCEELNLIHVTDLLVSKPLSTSRIIYTRLHGLGPRKYYYEYTSEDLTRLRDTVEKLDSDVTYVLFNNVKMYYSAKKFMEIT